MISIANFLEFINTQNLANSVLPLDVVKKLGSSRGFDENVTPNLKYSDRDADSFSDRSLLANALESVAQNDVERQKIAEYRANIANYEAQQKKLSNLKRQIKEMSFAKGPRDKDAISGLLVKMTRQNVKTN